MSVIRRNIAANIAANGWAVLISLAFVPAYIMLRQKLRPAQEEAR